MNTRSRAARGSGTRDPDAKTGYDEDLAWVHDVGFGHFAESAAPGILSMIGGPPVPDEPPPLVVELGCGSGILAASVATAGFRFLGYDASEAMLRLARGRLREAGAAGALSSRARFVKASFVDADLPPCRAVIAMGEVLGYLFDARASRGATLLTRLFRRVATALEPGGKFLFDLAGPDRDHGIHPRWREGEGWAILIASETDPARTVLTRRMTVFRKKGKHWRRSHEVHRLRLYPPAEIESMLRRTGLRVRRVRSYGGRAFPRGLTGFVARKP